MSDTKHTPGPWAVKDHPEKVCEIVAGPVPIGTVWCTDMDFGAANAALIASAPDLLRQRDALAAALGNLVRYLDEEEALGLYPERRGDHARARAVLRDVEGAP